MIYVTGDTHGEEGRFKYMESAMEKTLTENARDEDVWRHQTILWFDVRNIETNESIE